MYFGLPDPGPENVFFEDARRWVESTAKGDDLGREASLYDIVVHDCFSGGGVPEHLYTVEFFQDLKKIMSPDAVLVLVRRYFL